MTSLISICNLPITSVRNHARQALDDAHHCLEKICGVLWCCEHHPNDILDFDSVPRHPNDSARALERVVSTSGIDSVPRHDLCQWLPMKLQEEFTVLKAGRPMESGRHFAIVYAVGHQRLMF